MIHHTRNKLALMLVVLACLLALSSDTAQAQVRPFGVVGQGTVDFFPPVPDLEPGDPVPPGSLHDSEGWASFVGRYSGSAVVSPTGWIVEGESATFVSSVPFDFTSVRNPNNSMVFDYGLGSKGPGIVQVFPVAGGKVVALWDAEFTPAKDINGDPLSTGRFANVREGSFRMIAISDPFELEDFDIPYRWFGWGVG